MKKFILFSVFVLCLVTVSWGQYWIYDDLSEAKFDVGSTSWNTKVYIAGGDNGTQAVSEVEIYDIATETWDTTQNLSVGRSYPACVATASKVFFAGGLDWYTFGFYSEVDIWDTQTKTWEFEQLSLPRFSVCPAAHENTVLFAGGTNLALNQTYDVVDIFDIPTGTWTIDHLSAPRAAMAYAVTGDLAFFAGGFVVETSEVSDVVDIYHFSTGVWTTTKLSVGRCFLAGTAVGGKVLFAGGTTQENVQSDVVDIYDTLTGTWETAQLSVARSFIYDNAATVCRKGFFVGGGLLNYITQTWGEVYDVIDIYDGDLNQWSVDYLTLPAVNFTVTGVDNHLIKAGGQNPSPCSLLEIFVDESMDCFLGVKPNQSQDATINIYPNPSPGIFHLELNDDFQSCIMEVTLYNLQGQKVYERALPPGEREINVQLPNGVYVLKVQAGDQMQQELVTVQR